MSNPSPGFQISNLKSQISNSLNTRRCTSHLNSPVKKDFERVVKYIGKRCKDYPVYVNAGPVEDEDAIRLITLGFEFDQAGWIALIFDTRPEAACDGDWQSYIKEKGRAISGLVQGV